MLNEKMKKAIVSSFEARGFKVEFDDKNVIIRKGKKIIEKIPIKEYAGYFKLVE